MWNGQEKKAKKSDFTNCNRPLNYGHVCVGPTPGMVANGKPVRRPDPLQKRVRRGEDQSGVRLVSRKSRTMQVGESDKWVCDIGV